MGQYHYQEYENLARRVIFVCGAGGFFDHGFFCGDCNHGFSQNFGTDFHNIVMIRAIFLCYWGFIVCQRIFRWGRTGRTSLTCQTDMSDELRRGHRPFGSCCGVVKRIILLVVRILCRRVLALLWCCRWVRGCRFRCRVATLRCYCRRGRLRADICRWA